MSLIQYINEANKETLNKPVNTDQVYYSELKEWFTINAFRSLSIKYVLDGSIYYKMDRNEYRVQKDHFLLATKQPDVKAYFSNKITTKSLCIDICEDSLNDAFAVLSNEQKNEITDYTPDYMKQPYFIENVYPASESLLGKRLRALGEHLDETSSFHYPAEVKREWFLEMVELVILNESKNFKFLNSLNALKTSTRKEILKRVFIGKEYIDQFFLKRPDIKTIARVSNMSEFHFFRSFKQVFGDSPYQYLLGKRLEYASVLIAEKELLISEIAVECGFPDVFTFSKAFKRKYGCSPSKTLRDSQV